MDCLEFRRRLATDPRASAPAVRAHLDGCARCAAFHARTQAFETRLAGALAVPVPDELADQVLLAQLTGMRRRAHITRRRRAWIALAAAAVLALAIGVVQLQQAPPSLPDLVVAHVTGAERDALALRAPVAAARVAQAFADRGVRLGWVPAGIAYVKECPLGRWRSVHMVMPEDDAPVSVVYVVEHRAAADQTFRRAGFIGREVPIAQGTLVLLAREAGRFDALESTWRDAIEGAALAAADSR